MTAPQVGGEVRELPDCGCDPARHGYTHADDCPRGVEIRRKVEEWFERRGSGDSVTHPTPEEAT